MLFAATILIAEGIGGIWTGSLALLSDKAHILMDIFAINLSYPALPHQALTPSGAQLPLVLVNGKVLSSDGKISAPALRRKIESL
jgi:hypothetical protein